MDGLIAYALAKKYTDKTAQQIINAGFTVQVEQDRSILTTTGQEKVLYLIPKISSEQNDGYDEYVYANNHWEWVGGTSIDLSNYALKSEIPDVSGKYEKPSGGIPKTDLTSDVQTSLGKADSALQSEQYTGTYSKPSGGIPKTDLDSSVQSSLGKADTALQSHQDISGKENISNKVTSVSASSTDNEYPSAKCVYDAIESAIASQATDLSSATVTLSASSFTYDGTSKVPSVTSVVLDGQTLTSGTDYAVVSSPATNAGSYTLTVNGIGDYTGVVTASWTITKATPTISGDDSISIVGTGESVSKTYTTNSDGTFSFALSDNIATLSNVGGTVTIESTTVGTVTMTVSVAATSNYNAVTKTVSVAVTEAQTATVFGNVWDYSLSSPPLTRLTPQTDPLGVVTDCPTTHPVICLGSTQEGQSDFDNYLPWSGMVRKNYVSGELVDFTGYDNGETYVYIPPFWSKIVDDSEHSKMYFYISSEELTGFTKHPGSDRYVGRYQCDTNFESKPNGTPKMPLTLDEFKTGITAIDNNHQPYDIHTYSAICLLYLIELGTFDSQLRVGPGFIDSNTPFNMGSTDILTYHTGNCYIRNGNEQIQYRWIEGLWGNAMELINGILVSNNEIYICDDITKYSSSLTSDYEDTGLSLPTGADYITALHCFNNCYIFPKAASSGSSSTYVCDGLYNDSDEAGIRAIRVGGASWQRNNAGLFTFSSKINANSNVSSSSRPILIISNGGDA